MGITVIILQSKNDFSASNQFKIKLIDSYALSCNNYFSCNYYEMKELYPSKNSVFTPEMGDYPLVVKKGSFVNGTGLFPGACVLGIVYLGGDLYKVAHIPPGSIVTELTALLGQSCDGKIAVYQSNVEGFVEDLALGNVAKGKRVIIFTEAEALKRAFSTRDKKNAGLYTY